ncbi:MAG: ABC transporter substrate-binding protein [Candidatus Eremiobacteraeota bacterium]|nr:ABC transporter substrate-binding protein [Candidatus Eremiobacteraeota bacterium]
MFRQLRVLLASAVIAASAFTVTASAQTPGTIAIGYSGPLSGGAAQYGADVQLGIQMAIDEVNGRGGVTVGGKKTQLRLVALDDAYRPNEAATNAKRLAQQESAPIIFCSHSGGILAMMGFNEKQTPKFIVAAYSSEPQILKGGNASVVMIPPRYDAYFKPFAESAMARFGKRLGMIPTTTAYGNAWTAGFSATWKSMGGTVLTNNGVDYNTTADYSTVVSKALAERPDALFVGGPSQPTGLVIKAARDQGFAGGFVMMDQAKFDQIDQVIPIARLEGSVGVLPLRRFTGPGINGFLSSYAARFGSNRAANPEMANNYEGMHVLARAIDIAGSADPAKIMAALPEAARTLPNRYQPFTLRGVTKTGHLQGEAYAAVIDHGAYKRLTIPPLE